MSKNNIRRIMGLLFVFAVGVVFVCADLVVSSAIIGVQNSNSSTTQDETTRGGMMTSNSNSGSTNTGTTRRRRRRTKAAAAATTDAGMAGAATMDDGMRKADLSGTQTDLSGTYTGTVNYPEGGLSGPATVVVTGNKFTLTPDGGGAAVNGTITAVTTRGYTGVTLMFGDRAQIPVTEAPPPLPAVSLRARMMGGHVTMMSVPGEKREFSFTSAASAGSGRKRRMKKRASTGGGGTGTIKPPTP